MFRPHYLVLVASLVIGVTFVSTCQAQSDNSQPQNGVDCIQFPLFDFGDGQELYEADYYSNQECNSDGCGCTGGPFPEFMIFSSTDTWPQTCGNCNPEFTSTLKDALMPVPEDAGGRGIPKLKGSDRPLRSPLSTSKLAPFGESLKPRTYVDRDGKSHIVNPKNGFKVLLTKWVYITNDSGDLPIPVRLYAVQYNPRRAGIPAGNSAMKAPVRTTQIGFQFDAMPENEIASAPTLTVNQIGSFKHAGFVNLDSESGTFLIVTSTPLF